MAAIVEMMVARFGGVNAMGRRWAQLCESGGESFRRQTLRTLMVIDAGAAHALAAEMELYTAKLRSGQASAEDVTDALAKLGEDEVIDLACDSLQPLAEGDLLPSILIRMHKRGMLDDAQLKAVQRAVA